MALGGIERVDSIRSNKLITVDTGLLFSYNRTEDAIGITTACESSCFPNKSWIANARYTQDRSDCRKLNSAAFSAFSIIGYGARSADTTLSN
jgi:hypothetical protein